MHARLTAAVSLFLALTLLGACSPAVSVRDADPAALLADQLDTRLTGRSLSSHTRGALRTLDLVETHELDPLAAAATLRAEAGDDLSGPWLVAAAEVMLDLSLRTTPRDPTLDLRCAHEADLQLRYAVAGGGGLLGSDTEFAADLYHRAVSRVVEHLSDTGTLAAGTVEIGGAAGDWTIEIPEPASDDPRRLDATRYDRLLPADTLRVGGMAARHAFNGYGSPLVAIREQADAEPPRAEPFVPPEGEIVPATATLRFVGTRRAALELWNPDHTATIERHGGSLRLSTDITAPIATLFARTSLADDAKAGMLDTRPYIDRVGIYLHEPYDPDKIPLLMVHGLRSSPITWRNMLNSVRGDPVLRERYQVWMFLYPTGLPIFRSAAYLREELARACDHFDPERDDPWRGRMVVVGHSMGGLLTKMQTQDPGDALWASLSPEPFEELDAPDEVRDHFERVFFYDANPDIERVVFIATPHGGSSMADSFIGRLGDALVRLPGEFGAVDDWFDEQRRTGGAEADDYQIARGVPTSIDDLRPESPHLRAIRDLPLRDGVVAHAIIGNGAGDSDGVVPVESARFPAAVSELIVDAKHNAHEHPLAIREIRRILRAHVEAHLLIDMGYR